jgi:peptidyl-prolyl cis-trans isomerase B (cyclophilin B)
VEYLPPQRILGYTSALALIAVVLGFVVPWSPAAEMSASAATPSSSTPARSSSTSPLDGTLPPFKPPADVAANCTYPATSDPAAKPVDPPRSGRIPTDPAVVGVSITTNKGAVGLNLDNAKAPCTVNSFVNLATKGYFDGTSCHRLTSQGIYVLQCGDPKGDGTGGPGYRYADEYPANQFAAGDPALSQPVTYPRGTLAMANAGPNTNGSQFFLVYKDSLLPPNYTVFGTIDSTGLTTLDKIAAAGTADGSSDGKPASPVTITSARLD